MKSLMMSAAVLAAAMTSHASAQTVSAGGFYAGLSIGALVPSDTDQTTRGAVAGVPVSGSGKLGFKTGAAVGGRVGYRFGEHLAAEADLTYTRYRHDRLDGRLAVGPLAVDGAGFDGHVSKWLGFVNAVVTPWGRAGVTPYVGAGIGFSSYEATVNAIDTAAFGRLAMGSKTSKTDFAANAMAGVDWALTETVSVGARYRFIWTDSATTETSGGLTSEAGNARHHELATTLTYRF